MYFVFIYFLFAFVDAQLQTYNVVTNDFFKRNYGRVYFFFPKGMDSAALLQNAVKCHLVL